jgi:hypothetical protein
MRLPCSVYQSREDVLKSSPRGAMKAHLREQLVEKASIMLMDVTSKEQYSRYHETHEMKNVQFDGANQAA